MDLEHQKQTNVDSGSDRGCGFDEFKLKNFGLSHEDPHLFGTCQWSNGKPSVPYIIYRGLVALYFFVVIILNIVLFRDTEKWTIYLSHWSFIVLTISLCLMFASSIHVYYQDRRLKYSEELPMSWLYQLSWVFYNISYPAAVLVTILYWGFTYKGWAMTFINTNTHAVNLAVVFIDHFITAIPCRLFHVYQVISYGFCFVLFTIIYFVSGGLGSKGKAYIYSVIDYSKGYKNPLLFGAAVVFIAGPVCHVIIFGIYKLRVLIQKKCAGKKAKDSTDKFELEEKQVYSNEMKY